MKTNPSFFILLSLFITFTRINSQCLNDQRQLLLILKNDFPFNSSLSTKLAQWNQTQDCCNWGGVFCDRQGHVIAIDLSNENLSGNVNTSSTLFRFSHLETLNLGMNSFQTIQIPPLPKITEIDLSFNFFTGNLSSFPFQELPNLVKLDLQQNSFTGNIPISVFCHPSLQKLLVSNNRFSELFNELPSNCTSRINELALSYNEFRGQFPSFLFELDSLANVSISNNFFNGSVNLDQFQRLENLTILELSNNQILVNVPDTSSFGDVVKLNLLGLSSCNLSTFPDLRNQSNLISLDLSSNLITGEIPNWIWEIGNGSLYFLNLSSNQLTGLQRPFLFPDSISYLDLHSNNITGEASIPESAFYIDYSHNRFDNPIPSDLGNSNPYLGLLNLAFNRINGIIPQSLCNATNLEVLDVTNNNFTGEIPSCLLTSTDHVAVLNLWGNNFTGEIPDAFPVNCSLQTLDLGRNNIGGRIPPSLANCTSLEVMDVRHNNIDDNFPCFLPVSLRVLVMRGNRFRGEVTCRKEWPNLQVIDISSNSFSGNLHSSFLLSMREMRLVYNASLTPNYAGFRFTSQQNLVYEDSVTLTFREQEWEISRIARFFTAIDFSCNKFSGSLPDQMGELESLFSLNLSHNALTGSIPRTFGELTHLESLDFSMNELSGAIPNEIARLTFLSFMNLSYNQLSGRIPNGNQIRTLQESFFEGNSGLCGFPLNRSCSRNTTEREEEDDGGSELGIGIKWHDVSVVVGFSVGVGSVLWLLFGCRRIKTRFDDTVDQFLEKSFVSSRWSWS